MKLFMDYLEKNKNWLFFTALSVILFGVVLYLHNLPLDAVGYGALLISFLGALFLLFDFRRFVVRKKHLEGLKNQITIGISQLPPPSDQIEELYQELIQLLFHKLTKVTLEADKTRKELEDYYSLWVHQIKTPIAALDLLLQSQPGKYDHQFALELFKIEQYVEMVLHFLRIDSPSADLDFKRHNLKEIVQGAVRKYAKVFIHKKINLDLKELDWEVLTDAKWLGFVIEQILSNALKYTRTGTISIYLEDDLKRGRLLVIADTGLGIAKEDLPRIFEKGFTGYSGRLDSKSTGIGLYLVKLIMAKLSHTIFIESEVGQGTKVKLGLERTDLNVE